MIALIFEREDSPNDFFEDERLSNFKLSLNLLSKNSYSTRIFNYQIFYKIILVITLFSIGVLSSIFNAYNFIEIYLKISFICKQNIKSGLRKLST